MRTFLDAQHSPGTEVPLSPRVLASGKGGLRSKSFFFGGDGSNPSLIACFRASLRARRTASDFSRVLFSRAFHERRRFISRKTPSRCIFFLSTRVAWSILLSRTNTCNQFSSFKLRMRQALHGSQVGKSFIAIARMIVTATLLLSLHPARARAAVRRFGFLLRYPLRHRPLRRHQDLGAASYCP